jgi:hypothetical protein
VSGDLTASDFLSECRGRIFSEPEQFYTVQDDPELAEMVSIGRAIQWELEAEWREWCQETFERARFYADA